MSDVERRFHETWLGMAQPVEGLVVSVPVLVDAQCMHRLPPSEQAKLTALCATGFDAARFLHEILGYPADAFDTVFHADLKLDVVEGHQTLVPSRGLKRQQPPPQKPEGLPDDSTPTSRAAEPYLALTWELPKGLDLDSKERTTGEWFYEPTAKFERLLRAARVPIGLLFNGDAVRLVFAPHGESTGHLTFRLADLTTTSGRPLFDAMVMLLHARRFFGVLAEFTLPSLLEQSRRRQANVTEALAGQVFEALNLLLAGFEAAAERDRNESLDEAMRRGEDHIYGGLLTVLLRLVFVLYAEDRGLLPTDSEPYDEDLSVKALYEQLLADAGAFPDAMGRRFGAWPRLLALFRCVFLGASHGKLRMPARRGQLFDPERFPFLEGWMAGGAPVEASAVAAVQVPTVDDGTIFQVLDKLIVLEGQRLSYQSLDVEQIGSVYEALMGYHVKRLSSAAVCLKPNDVWVCAAVVLEQEPSRRAAWLEDEGALESKAAKAVSDGLKKAKAEAQVLEALDGFRVKRVENKPAGRLVLQPGTERRRTSSHYTPRSLSSPIVRRALEPLLKAMGERPTSERLLNLKICDPAMGSGAFLVEACRFLADQVVAAWTREGVLTRVAKDDDIVMRARRLVAQRCLYGVDKNPFAVNLAKLSLWLVTLAKAEPFTFLDHALKCGDSLVGLDLEQIRAFNWSEGKQKQLDITGEVFKKAMSVALEKRQQILELATELDGPLGRPKQLGLDPSRRKEELLRDADEALEPLRRIADACIGAFFAADSDKGREKERLRRLDVVGGWVARGASGTPPDFGPTPVTFHWPLEYPEVFHGKRLDPLDADQVNRAAWMDCFVGNPPFLGGRRMRGELGDHYVGWLETVYAGSSLNADLSAFFFRRSFALLGIHGTFGLIATNTIGQGDTRTTALQPILSDGGLIFDAVRGLKWPGAANVIVSVVHVAKGGLAGLALEPRLDGRRVEVVNSRLRPKPEQPPPFPLRSNEKTSFQGNVLLGLGFVLTPEQRQTLIQKDPRNGERVFLYLGGEDVNSDPDPSTDRYVINFGQMELEDSEEWPDLIAILRRDVKPQRDRAKDKFWWRHWRPRSELYEALRSLKRCLVAARVTKHLMFSFHPTNAVFNEKTIVFPSDADRWLALLQSRVHSVWAWLLSSTMKTDLNYAPSDCFETFPFPTEPGFADLDSVGAKLNSARHEYMSANGMGLTTTYNRLKDESVVDEAIVALRRLHEDLDRAVLDAYGWNQIAVPPFCGATPKQLEAFEDEVLDELFKLNAARAKAEALLPVPMKPKGRSKAKQPA